MLNASPESVRCKHADRAQSSSNYCLTVIGGDTSSIAVAGIFGSGMNEAQFSIFDIQRSS